MILIEQLREGTRELHEELEGSMHGAKIMDGSLKLHELVHLLQVNYNYFHHLESTIVNDATLSAYVTDRAAMACADILNSGFPVVEIQPAVRLESHEQMLGALYVGLGSLLGGQLIHQKISQNRSLNSLKYTFYENSRTYMRVWKDFLGYLSAVNKTVDVPAVVNAAQVAFRSFNTLFEQIICEENTCSRR